MISGSMSPYYKDSGRIPVASRLSWVARRRIFDCFMAVMRPSPETSVLDIGITSDAVFKESNFFEQFYPYKERIVCVGTEDGGQLERLFPGVRFIRVEPGQGLPFSDRQFNVVFSNAVVEHVGGMAGQRTFIAEACRVGTRVFITTPNRWFPVEHHTGIPLLHYLPKGVHRRLLRATWLDYWSFEENLNLLTERSFSTLFPPRYPVKVVRNGIGLGCWKSNLVAFTVDQGEHRPLGSWLERRRRS